MRKKRKEVFMMKNQKMWKGFVIGLCISALTGCGTGTNEETGGVDRHVTEEQSSMFDDQDRHSDENDNIAPADGYKCSGDISGGLCGPDCNHLYFNRNCRIGAGVYI